MKRDILFKYHCVVLWDESTKNMLSITRVYNNITGSLTNCGDSVSEATQVLNKAVDEYRKKFGEDYDYISDYATKRSAIEKILWSKKDKDTLQMGGGRVRKTSVKKIVKKPKKSLKKK